MSRAVIGTYREESYCSVCEREWVKGQRRADADIPLIAERLRRGLKHRSMKFREVAHHVGISEVVVGRYVAVGEEADPARPGLETFVRICRAAGIHPNEVLGFEDPRVARLEAEVIKWRKTVAGITEVLLANGVHLGDKPDSNLQMGNRLEREERYADESETY